MSKYTAIDVCCHYLAFQMYPHCTANNTLDLIENASEDMPLPIQRRYTGPILRKIIPKNKTLGSKPRQMMLMVFMNRTNYPLYPINFI